MRFPVRMCAQTIRFDGDWGRQQVSVALQFEVCYFQQK
jgi:hypothetical protein